MKHTQLSILATLLILVLSTIIPIAHSEERAGDDTASEPSFVVVLKDGRRVPARTKPVCAFGKVRFMEPGGPNRVLPVSEVDIDRTREANAAAPKNAAGGTLSIGGELVRVDPSKPVDAGRTTSDVAKPRTRSVKVYSATWCPYCKQLKMFLAENGISASITEVDLLPEAEKKRAEAEMQRLTNRVSFPTVVIGDRAVAGFSPGWILKSLGG